MKLTKITLSVALLGALTAGMAAQTAPSQADVDAQIAKIQNAPVQARTALMNQFKSQLSSMSQQDRSAAIAKLQAKLGETANGAKSTLEAKKAKAMGYMNEDKMKAALNQGMNQMNNMANQAASVAGGMAAQLPMGH